MTESVEEVKNKFSGVVLEVVDFRGETTLVVKPQAAKDILGHLKSGMGFNYLVDISCTHWPESGLVEVVYLARNLGTREQLRVRTALPEEDARIATVSDIWRTADWLEREVWDLMGVRFEGHPDLKRIMLPEDFKGHPLRKDFPMEGDDEWRNFLPSE